MQAILLPTTGTLLFSTDGADRFAPRNLPPTCMREVPVAGQPFDTAIEVDVDQQGDQPWTFALAAPVMAPIAAGDVVHLRLWARCAFSNSGSARLAVIAEQASEPHAKLLDLPVTVGSAWECVDLPFVASQGYAAGAWQLSIRLGYMPQRVQFGPVSVTGFGQSISVDDLPRRRIGYAGREATAEWRDAAAERIERFRKSDLRVVVTGPAGQPLRGATVRATLARSAFGLGTCVSQTLLAEGPDADRYRDTLLRLFNCAVIENDLKWQSIAKRGYDAGDRLVDWLTSRGLPVRGHCLLWPGERYLPADALALVGSPAALRDCINAHVAETASRYRGRLVDWDVVNEPFAHHLAMDVLGPGAMAEWFTIAHAADPVARLYINDYEILASGDMLDTPHQEHYFRTVADLLDRGAPLHGLGMQGHFGSNITSPANLLQILDRFASLGVRIKVTELDFQLADESLRADYLRDFFLTLYSHPAVDGILQWGFWAGSHWIPTAAFIDRNWNLLPHGIAYEELVTRTLLTDATAVTDDAGQCNLRGHLGEYSVSVRHEGAEITKPITLTQDGATLTVQVAG